MRRLLLAGSLAAVLLGTVLDAATRMVDLRCEYAVDPLGIDLTQPRLFWRLESDQRGERQTAWQVLVAGSAERLARDEGDLWDSGQVEGDRTIHVPYNGARLESSQQVFWKVRGWDARGEALPWSDPATWTMGQLDPVDWRGKWIAAQARHETVMLRRDFAVRPGLKRALIHISGLGHYELFINGQKAGDDVLSPGWTDYHESTLYDTRDVTEWVKAGENALGVVLANGMYHVERRNRFAKFTGSFGVKRLIADLRLEYADGSVEVIATDERWRTHPGAVTYSSMYGGEDFDARRLPEGWSEAGFDASGWEPAVPVLYLPDDTLRGHRAGVEPMAPIEVRLPVREIQLSARGGVTYDLGQNTSYMPRIRVSGPAGSRVRLVPGELIYPDGYVSRASMGGAHRGSSWWEFTKATDGVEEWFPQFYYVGCRYLQTQAFAAEEGGELPRIESLEGVIVHATAEPVGDFTTSDPLLNDIRELVRWAQRSNMVSVLTDCPHREKLGWLEQYHLNGPGIRYEFDMARMFTKGMQDMADAQTWEGLVPNIAPEFVEFNGHFRAAAEWGAAFFAVPWQQYQFLADTALLERHYDAMKRYFAYLESQAENDILSQGLGDWYDLGPQRLNRSELTPAPLTATAFFYRDAWILAEVAELLGRPEDAAHFAARAEAIRQRFNAAFFNAEAGYYGENSQTANALPLVFNMVEPAERGRVFAHLLEDLESRDHAMTAGDVGFRFLIQALADGGAHEAIFRMLSRTDDPGYGYILAQGATALTESWDADPSSSHNHFMLGHVTEWFYEDLLGIDQDPAAPGFQNVIIRPQPVGDLSWAEGRHQSLHGLVAVRWERQADGGFRLQAEIPANTTATLHLPLAAAVLESGAPVAEAEGVRFLRHESGRAVFALTSGRFDFVTKP